MISLSPLDPGRARDPEDFHEIEYLLRRADHAAVAAIRAVDQRAMRSHAVMAQSYSLRSQDLMSKLDLRAAP
jgi:hypothetical protein